MSRRVGIHDCTVRYRQNLGIYTLSAIIYGDSNQSVISSKDPLPKTTQVELILDTGAAYLSVKPSLFQLIRPRSVTPSRIVGASGIEQPSQQGLVDVVVDGRLRVNDVGITEIGELPYRNISGLLGMSFLQYFGIYFHAKPLRSPQSGESHIPLLRFHYYSEDNYERG